MNHQHKKDLDVLLHISKAEIKKYCRHTMTAKRPDDFGKITDKSINQTVLYMEGYCDAMKYHVEEPINRQEMKEFLLSISYEYISKHIIR